MSPPLRFALLVLVVLAAIAAMAALASAVPGTPPAHGDWLITIDTEFKGRTGFVEQSLLVQGGTTLTIEDSFLTVNRSLTVQTQANLVVINSTLAFNCTPIFDNALLVLNNGKVTIRDKDGDWRTPNDRSIITSATTVMFNFTLVRDATLRLLNSEVSRCGRHLVPNPIPEGLTIRTNNSEATGTIFKECNVGLVLDTISSPMVSNCTFDSCEYGIWGRGLTDATVRDCTFTRSGTDAIFLRGFLKNLLITRCTINRSGNANVELVYPSGLSNTVADCTIGPGGSCGILMDTAESFTFSRCSVTGCSVGVEVRDSTVTLEGLNITDCTLGLVTSGSAGGKLTMTDLSIVRSGLAVDTSTVGNLTYSGFGTIAGATGTLATFILVEDGGALNLTDSTLSFLYARGKPTGIIAKERATLNMSGCTVDSPVSGAWVFKLLSLSQFNVERCELLHLGIASGALEDRGLYVAGGGSITDLDVTDSVYGIVTGRTQATIANITATRCLTAIYVDGGLGKGGMEVKNLRAIGCGKVALVLNNETLSMTGSDIEFDGEGFNISRSTVIVKDSEMHPPQAGQRTAALDQTSTLSFFNSTFTPAFSWGTGINTVNVYWYLDLTVKVIDPPGAPLVNGSVSIHDKPGTLVIKDASTRSTGRLPRLELRHMSYINGVPSDGTPHVVTVSKGALSDSFSVTMDRNRTMTFVLDNVHPLLVLLSPAPLSAFNTSTVTFNGTASDAVATENEGIDHLSFRVDNGSWVDFALTGADSWSFQVALADGWRFVEVMAVDRIGNTAMANVTILVDTVPPSLTIISPVVPAPPTNKRTLSVIGKTDRSAAVTVDGAAVTVLPSGAFSTNVTLSEGPNTIRIVAVDAFGNARSSVIDVTLDTVAPVVVLDPAPPERTRDASVRIAGTKEPGATLTVTADGTTLTGPKGASTFDILVDLVNGRANQITIVSVDDVGNPYHISVNVTRDSTPPKLTVAQLPAYSKARVVSVQGTVDDPAAEVTVNGLPAPLSGTTFSTQVDLVEGPNTITIGAVDELGNVATPLVMNVTLDTSVPGLRISTDSHVSVDVDHAMLAGTTDAGMTVHVLVTYGAYSKTYTVVTGPTGAFEFDIEMPQVGNHTVVVTVEDPAGNKAVDTLTFERTQPKPVVPPPEESHWLQDNWVYLVLLASIVTSLLVVSIIVVPSKRRREARQRIRKTNLATRAARKAEAAKGAEGDEGTEESAHEGAGGDDDEGVGKGAGGSPKGDGWEEYEESGEGSEEAEDD